MNRWLLFLVFIVTSCGIEHESDQSDTKSVLNFNEHIAPIIHNNCTPCHRPGQAGPFSLITYNDIAKRSKMIHFVTSTGIMPPWPADNTYRKFANEKHLTEIEKNTIAQWIKDGKIEGLESKKPDAPVFPTESQLGEPDLVINMMDTFFIKGNNTDQFLIMKAPWQMDEPAYIKALEFIPGNREAVHHMNGQMLNYDKGKKLDPFFGQMAVNPDTITNQNAFTTLDLANDDGSYPPLTQSVLNYLPGMFPQVYPKGIGGYKMAEKGAFLMYTMHYGPLARDTFDLSKFNIFLTHEKPERPIQEIQIGSLFTEIKPEFVIYPDSIQLFKSSVTIQEDISVLNINPHMHLLGKSFKAYAITLAHDTIPLVYIPKWDFRWQYAYAPQTMLKLAKGSTIMVEGVFDNTSSNPLNPFFPPKEIREPEGDMKTTDEMLQFFITYVPYKRGDENISLEYDELMTRN